MNTIANDAVYANLRDQIKRQTRTLNDALLAAHDAGMIYKVGTDYAVHPYRPADGMVWLVKIEQIGILLPEGEP